MTSCQAKKLAELESTRRDAIKMGGGTVGVSPTPKNPPNPKGEADNVIHCKGLPQWVNTQSKGSYFIKKTR